MFKNYIFDLYGTLVDINTDERKRELWQKLALLYGYKGAYYSADEIMRDYLKFVEEEKSRAAKRHPEYEEIDIKIEKVFERLFLQKNIIPNRDDISQICSAFRCVSTVYIKLYDGTLDLLQTLKAKGKGIYLLSNAQRGFTQNELNLLCLTQYFDGIVISSDEECSKPDKHFFDILINRYKLDKTRSVMIGNDYISDIRGAKSAGIKSLYIHQSISPEIKGELAADYRVMDGDVYKIKKMIVR